MYFRKKVFMCSNLLKYVQLKGEDMIDLIDIQVTSKCNRSCNFCYAIKYDIDFQMEFDLFKNIIIQTLENGVKNICISGGEPFLHPDIYKMLEFSKKQGLNVAVSSNGDNLDIIKTCIPYIDVIGLPLESYKRELHDKIRGKNSFDNIIKLLKYIRDLKNAPIVRIGTVVDEHNVNDIFKMGEVINSFSKISIWKIYEKIEYGFLRKMDVKFISDELKRNIIENIKYANTIISGRKERTNAYFIIEPNGEIFIPILDEIKDEKKYLGNINKKLTNIIIEWKKYSHKKNHMGMKYSIFQKECTYE